MLSATFGIDFPKKEAWNRGTGGRYIYIYIYIYVVVKAMVSLPLFLGGGAVSQ